MKKLLIVAGLALTALPIHAAEEGAALSPFAGDLGNAIWTLAIFVIVVIVLGKFAWGPVLGLLQQREEFIHRALSEAKRDRDDAELRLKEYAAKLQSAHVEAGTIVEDARRDAERLREEVRQRAKSEADKMLDNAQRGRFSSKPSRGALRSDPARGGRSVRDDRVEDHPAQPEQGRQRAPDRRGAQAGRAGRAN